MKLDVSSLLGESKNFVLLGEAGCGKSEFGISLALALKGATDRQVHFFDLDMTKPLFRSRDASRLIMDAGIVFHAQEQFMDAPTQIGGVETCLKNPDYVVILDVGGDYIGARAIGWYAPFLNRDDTSAFYIVNAYRPWSDTIDHIDETLGKILGMSHVELKQLRIVSNPNNGVTTTADEVISGHLRTRELLDPYIETRFLTVKDDILNEVEGSVEDPVFPIHLALTYPWLMDSI